MYIGEGKLFISVTFTICINQLSESSDCIESCLKAILYSIDPLFSAIYLNKESIRLWSSASIDNCPARISTAAVDVRTGRC